LFDTTLIFLYGLAIGFCIADYFYFKCKDDLVCYVRYFDVGTQSEKVAKLEDNVNGIVTETFVVVNGKEIHVDNVYKYKKNFECENCDTKMQIRDASKNDCLYCPRCGTVMEGKK